MSLLGVRRVCAVLLSVLLGGEGAVMAGDHTQEEYDEYSLARASQWTYRVRAGYSIGGTLPLPFPTTLRSINGFKPKGGFTAGFEGTRWLNHSRWAITLGGYFFIDGMQADVTIKDYDMILWMNGESVQGNYTGDVVIRFRLAGLRFPALCTFRMNPRWNLSFGPTFTHYIHPEFNGEAYQGYLREGSPTGPKVVFVPENPATFEFNDQVNENKFGAQVAFDFRIFQHLSAFGLVDMAFLGNGVFKESFSTIPFPLYATYATLGLAFTM